MLYASGQTAIARMRADDVSQPFIGLEPRHILGVRTPRHAKAMPHFRLLGTVYDHRIVRTGAAVVVAPFQIAIVVAYARIHNETLALHRELVA